MFVYLKRFLSKKLNCIRVPLFQRSFSVYLLFFKLGIGSENTKVSHLGLGSVKDKESKRHRKIVTP